MKCLVTIAALVSLAPAQDRNSQAIQPKHLAVAPMNFTRPVLLSAMSIERGAGYPSVVELKGDVEIRTPVCIHRDKTASRKVVLVCDGETVLRADEAVFHEDTGEVEARGTLTVFHRADRKKADSHPSPSPARF